MFGFENSFNLGKTITKAMLIREHVLFFCEDCTLMLYDLAQAMVVEVRQSELTGESCFKIADNRFISVDALKAEIEFYEVGRQRPHIQRKAYMDMVERLGKHIIIRGATKVLPFDESNHFLMILYSHLKSHFLMLISCSDNSITYLHEQPDSPELVIDPLDRHYHAALYYRWPKHERNQLGCINYKVLNLKTGRFEEVRHEDTEGSVDRVVRLRVGLEYAHVVFVNSLLRRVPPRKYGNGCHMLIKHHQKVSELVPVLPDSDKNVRQVIWLESAKAFAVHSYTQKRQCLSIVRPHEGPCYELNSVEITGLDQRKGVVLVVRSKDTGNFTLVKAVGRAEAACLLVQARGVRKQLGVGFATRVVRLLAGGVLTR